MAGEKTTQFIEKAIYGLITVLAVLVVMEEHPPRPGRAALALFGATLAVALVDTYAATIAELLTRKRHLIREEIREIWHGVRPVMIGAQAPTFVMLLSALGLFPVERAIRIAEVVIVVFLFGYGLRVGQLLHQSFLRQVISGLILVAIAGLVVAIKVLFH